MPHLFLNAAHMQMFPPRAQRELAEASPDDVMAYWGEFSRGVMEYEVKAGVAVIDIAGALVSAQIPLWFFYGDMTYESIVETIRDAVENAEVKAVLVRFNSPGGTVTGCAEAAAAIDALSALKPIVAHCQMADSAAFWLASSMNEIHVDPTGEVGSIGVICTHTDISEALAEWGVKVKHIFSGRHKADGSPYAPLSEQAEERFQADMDYLRGIFVDAVAKYRSMKKEDVAATEALTYIGQRAVDIGLADGVVFSASLLQMMQEID